jgi:hypothetical protein
VWGRGQDACGSECCPVASFCEHSDDGIVGSIKVGELLN